MLLAFSSTGASKGSTAPSKEVDAITLQQKHIFFGKVAVTATNNALRIDDKGGLGFVLVAKAPDWTVHIFRDKNKLILSESFDRFMSAGLVNEILLTHKEPAARGVTANEVRKQFMGFSIAETQFPTPFQFLPLPKGSDEKLSLILNSAFRTHYVDGFPVLETSIIKSDLVSGNMMKNRRQTDLATYSIAKVKVSSDIFEAPKGYVTAKFLPEVVSGPNSKEQTSDLEDMLGSEPIRK